MVIACYKVFSMTQRPFLLLSTRPEDESAAEELDSFARAMRIPSSAIE